MNDRVITIRGTDPINKHIISAEMKFDSSETKDSEALKYMLCEFDPGDNYTVEFESLIIEIPMKEIKIGDIIPIFGEFKPSMAVKTIHGSTIYTESTVIFYISNDTVRILRNYN